MRAVIITAGLICAMCAAAQETPGPALTADRIIEKSIEAAGGREAMEKLTSTMSKGTMEFTAQGMHSTVEFYAKAPNKRLIVMNMEGFGEVKQGFDGTVAWSSNPAQGVTEVTGEALANVKRDAVFNDALKWRERYTKAELKGKRTVGGREVYAVEMTPKAGSPVTNYYDAETFLLVGFSGMGSTPQGPTEIRTEMSEYREIGDGVKAPFRVKQIMPAGEIVMKYSEIKNNIDIDDARFSKPAPEKKSAPDLPEKQPRPR